MDEDALLAGLEMRVAVLGVSRRCDQRRQERNAEQTPHRPGNGFLNRRPPLDEYAEEASNDRPAGAETE